MNHKRKRTKKQRAGCLLCKPHKCNGACTDTRQEKLSKINEKEQVE